MEENKESTIEEVEQEQEQEQEQDTGASVDSVVIEALKQPSPEVQKLLNELIQAEVKKALAGTTPKRATAKQPIITKAEFDKMSYKQKVELYNTNQELYNKLKGE